jgi:transcriptional regulator
LRSVWKKKKKRGVIVGHNPMYLWVLLVEEIGVHVDNHRSSSSHRQTLS